MAHELSIAANGAAEMFSGNNIVPWHGLGTVVEGKLTAESAIQAAHLDWSVDKIPLFVNTGKFSKVSDYFAVARGDDHRVLGVVKKNYRPVQNAEAFSFFDKVVGEGRAVYETAGALNDGKRVWIMAKLPSSVFVGGNEEDKIERMVLLYNTHDGTSSVSMMLVSTRVVCANTLSVALKGVKNQIRIRHTANFDQRVEEAQRTLNIAQGYFNDLDFQLQQLAKTPMTIEHMKAFTETLIPDTGTKYSTRTMKTRSEIVSLFTEGTGNRGKTSWDALNAVTEYADHRRKIRTSVGRSLDDLRFEGSLFGTGAVLKTKAFDLLVN